VFLCRRAAAVGIGAAVLGRLIRFCARSCRVDGRERRWSGAVEPPLESERAAVPAFAFWSACRSTTTCI